MEIHRIPSFIFLYIMTLVLSQLHAWCNWQLSKQMEYWPTEPLIGHLSKSEVFLNTVYRGA